MRLVTIQDIFVQRQIEYKIQNNKLPKYICERVFFTSKEQELYNKLIDKMKDKIGFPKDKVLLPIWCWVIRKDDEITDDLINELIERCRPMCQFPTLYELDVPNDGVLITNYDIWNNLLFDSMINIPLKADNFNKLFEKQKGATLQACIPFIHGDFIKSYKQIESYMNKDYNETENEIKSLISSGKIQLDDDGYIEKMITDER